MDEGLSASGSKLSAYCSAQFIHFPKWLLGMKDRYRIPCPLAAGSLISHPGGVIEELGFEVEFFGQMPTHRFHAPGFRRVMTRQY